MNFPPPRVQVNSDPVAAAAAATTAGPMLEISPSVVEKRTTVRITPSQVSALKCLFFEMSMETRPKCERKLFVQQLTSSEDFSILQYSQIFRVLKLYLGEMQVRRGIGNLFAATTEAMIHDETPLGSHFVVLGAEYGLSNLRMLSQCSEYDNLPTVLGAFVRRAFAHTEYAANNMSYETTNFTNSNNSNSINNVNSGRLQAGDEARIRSFVLYFQRVLLPLYGRIWRDFSLLEENTSIQALRQGRPDLSLADEELDMAAQRQSWLRPGHEVQELFFSLTYAGDALRGRPLYTHKPSSDYALPSPFALMAMQHDNLECLKAAIFGGFEQACYSFYSKHLLLMSKIVRNAAQTPAASASPRTSTPPPHTQDEQDDEEGEEDQWWEEGDGVEGGVGGTSSTSSSGGVKVDSTEEQYCELLYCAEELEDDEAGDDMENVTVSQVLQSVEQNGVNTETTKTTNSPHPSSSTPAAVLEPARTLQQVLSIQDLSSMYYVAGAALRAALGLVHAIVGEHHDRTVVTSVLTLLSTHTTCDLCAARSAGLPVQATVARQRDNCTLLLVSQAVFDFVLSLEEDVILPVMRDDVKCCVLGAQVYVYMSRKMLQFEKYDMLGNIFLDIMHSDTALSVLLNENVLYRLCDSVCTKFIDFYMKVTLVEYTKNINRKLKVDKNINKLSFRTQAMLSSLSNIGK